METIVQLPQALYDLAVEQAHSQRKSLDHYVAELLAERLLPPHAHVEVIPSRSGLRAVVRGTRIGVDVIIGYVQAGATPQEVAQELLPDLTLAQVYDALSYYEDQRLLFDKEIEANTVIAWQKRLQEQIGTTAMSRLLGQHE
ncbi:MAG: DUF433 domain-containing protein [Ardenticatenaceae bacterium]|nr:DUF433 domain-containing protein [Ardenticatenaceae bacterium]